MGLTARPANSCGSKFKAKNPRGLDSVPSAFSRCHAPSPTLVHHFARALHHQIPCARSPAVKSYLLLA